MNTREIQHGWKLHKKQKNSSLFHKNSAKCGEMYFDAYLVQGKGGRIDKRESPLDTRGKFKITGRKDKNTPDKGAMKIDTISLVRYWYQVVEETDKSMTNFRKSLLQIKKSKKGENKARYYNRK